MLPFGTVLPDSPAQAKENRNSKEDTIDNPYYCIGILTELNLTLIITTAVVIGLADQ